MRDNFTNETKQILARRVGYRCSNPICRKPTSGPQENAGAVNIGEAAHITAASGGCGAKRYDPSMSPQERKSPDNGIWLCGSCARLIDRDERRYSVEKLHKWKILAEQRALLELEMGLNPDEVSQNHNASQEFKNGSGTQFNIGNTAIGHQTVYNHQASEFFDEVKNGVRTTYKRNPITGGREIVGQELA
jgi:hypothetical protein